MITEEIAELLHLPFPELVEACRNPETLATVISLCYQQGIKIGEERILKDYNQMFRGYNRVSISNQEGE